MKISYLLKSTTSKLKKSEIPSARLDCLILIEDLINKDRSWILANPEFEVSDEQVHEIDKQIERRANHEPLSYIRGKSAFYGREFFITSDTLQPRPETETMIEMFLEMTNEKRQMQNVIDVGTGSGAIAITIKLDLPSQNVIATDISEPCLIVAEKNAKHLKAKIDFVQTNLVSDIKTNRLNDSILCCNLPYVPDSFTINQAAMFEPEIAIFGGKNGLEYYEQLFDQIKSKSAKPRAILTESLPPQHHELAELAKKYGYKLKESREFIQHFSL